MQRSTGGRILASGRKPDRPTDGFSLTELLVAVTVLALALLPIWRTFQLSLRAIRRANNDFQANCLLASQSAKARLQLQGGTPLPPVQQAMLTLPDGSVWRWRQWVRFEHVEGWQPPAGLYRVDARIDGQQQGVTVSSMERLPMPPSGTAHADP